ncbi:hypothetical protein DOY81_004933 [Sarcophaga bullata]|nr:hypothetical protein DOY81_004933 [Sarcophaga bullata]
MCDVANEIYFSFIQDKYSIFYITERKFRRRNFNTNFNRNTQCKMLKQKKGANLFSRILAISFSLVLFSGTSQSLSDKRLCADRNCKDIISLGVGQINYIPGNEGMVSFRTNSIIRIKSKSAGKDPSLWGVEVNGREGYAPKEFIRETKIFISEKDLKFEVDVAIPGTENILSTSENVAKEEHLEITTTKPLDLIPIESTEKPLSTPPTVVTEIESTEQATAVLIDWVDGTQIPVILDNESLENVRSNTNDIKKLEEDYELVDEIGDYDEEEEEEEVHQRQEAVELEESGNPASEQNEINKNLLNKNEIGNQIEQQHSEISPTEILKESFVSDDNSAHYQTLVNSVSNELAVKNKNVHIESIRVEQNIQEEKPIFSSNSTDETHVEDATVNSLQNTTTDESKNTQKENVQAERNTQEEKLISNHFVNEHKNETPTEASTVNSAKNENTDESKNTQVEQNTREEKLTMLKNISKEYNKKETHIEESTVSSVNNEKTDVSKNSEKYHENIEHYVEEQPIISNSSESGFKTETKFETLKSDKNDSSSMLQISIQTENVGNQQVEIGQLNSIVTDDKSDAEVKEDKSENEKGLLSELSKPKEELSPYDHESIYYSTTSSRQLPTEEGLNNLDTTSVENQVYKNTEMAVEDIRHEEESKTVTTTFNSFTEGTTEIPLTPQINRNKEEHLPSLKTEEHYKNLYEQLPTYENADYENIGVTENPVKNFDLEDEPSTGEYANIESLQSVVRTDAMKFEEKQTKAPLSLTPPSEHLDIKENKGLFATIMGTVNNVLSINNKMKYNTNEDNTELDRILFSGKSDENVLKGSKEEGLQYCKQIGPNGECPQQEHNFKTQYTHCDCSVQETILSSDLTLDGFIKVLGSKILEISEVLAFLVIVAVASLFFIFGYYCFCNSSREGSLLSKLNQLESSLLASQKENAILKHNLMSTRQKLVNIEDNSFGSNDMVLSLKKELEEELLEKARLQDQITNLQKELENAADAGIELNKIVSELLSNQAGDESIISSVEELQKQLNEQQNTIFEINASLAEKSRENSELQLLIAEQNARYESQLSNLQRDNDELEHEKANLLSQLEDLKNDFDRDMTAALEGKNIEIKRLQTDIVDLNNKIEGEHTKWQTSVAKVEALEECLKNIRKDPSVNIKEIIDVANVKAQLIEAQKRCKSFKEKLESEVDSRKLAENQLQIISAEVEKLKQDFNQSEKDKLEAQTRLEVLSNYFREKENQLQKELSLKEAMWLKQQGETTTTVDRLTAMQEEIQSLKSQNDSLRAEIEAQVAAHKAQTGTLENRAHETWLAARQSDRRCEEARAEATALRRKLTALAGSNINESSKPSTGPITLSEDLANAPSPIQMESPGSPMLGRMPPPPFLPPPFMGPPPPFIGMPPPPSFVPPGEMRPAPLGRIMSPPPQRSGRFSPQHLDYEDYLDYEGNNTWHRHTYSPPPRTYRSLSPSDSRYDYGTERDLISTYDTETDCSPPPSPRESRRRGANSSEKSDLTKNVYNAKRFNNKGPLSSGSEKSYNSPSHHDAKTKKGSTSGDKSVV